MDLGQHRRVNARRSVALGAKLQKLLKAKRSMSDPVMGPLCPSTHTNFEIRLVSPGKSNLSLRLCNMLAHGCAFFRMWHTVCNFEMRAPRYVWAQTWFPGNPEATE